MHSRTDLNVEFIQYTSRIGSIEIGTVRAGNSQDAYASYRKATALILYVKWARGRQVHIRDWYLDWRDEKSFTVRLSFNY